MKKLKTLFKFRRGEGYIDTVVSVMVIMMLIVLSLNVFSFLTAKQDMDYFAREMVETAAVNGRTYCAETYIRYYELSGEVGFYPDYSWTADYYNTSYRQVQYGDTIRITVRYTKYLEDFGVFRIPVTMTATYSALSQKYWK